MGILAAIPPEKIVLPLTRVRILRPIFLLLLTLMPSAVKTPTPFVLCIPEITSKLAFAGLAGDHDQPVLERPATRGIEDVPRSKKADQQKVLLICLKLTSLTDQHLLTRFSPSSST
ncbi:hypothetical protein [uncultured Gimesia sp.]|uniref:hypothetical protein n=1 Tax=uncultured Gimesia sp. TaxID=1678688 RepID=UPI0026388C96|nr:hypothetical protein [uncultured Gimesia sp.]